MDFSKIWASNGNVVDIDDTDYATGFEFIGQAPPSRELFNELFQSNDEKLAFLYERGNFWKAGTNYAIGDVVKSTSANDYRLMKCITAGVSGATEPTWTVTSTNVGDNTVTWFVLDTRLLPVLATQAQAETGTDNEARMSPLRTKQAIDYAVTNLDFLNKTYPIGSIYMSVLGTSPATLFGGTWSSLTSGRMLIAQNSTYVAGSTGGEATHKLTESEMPSHTHTFKHEDTSSNNGSGVAGGNTGQDYTTTTSATGGDQAHNNMPPYLAVYMWKRTL